MWRNVLRKKQRNRNKSTIFGELSAIASLKKWHLTGDLKDGKKYNHANV